MDVVFAACCGIDVHQKSLVACVRVIGAEGRVRKDVRTFATTTAALAELARWLQTLARHPRRDGIDRGVLETRLARAGSRVSRCCWSIPAT